MISKPTFPFPTKPTFSFPTKAPKGGNLQQLPKHTHRRKQQGQKEVMKIRRIAGRRNRRGKEENMFFL